MSLNYEGFVGHEQNVRINILDAETKKVIPNDFYILNEIADKVAMGQTINSFIYKYSRISRGSDNYPCFSKANCTYVRSDYSDTPKQTDLRAEALTFQFEESHIQAMGYDYSSIEGNVIIPEINTRLNIPELPEIINIYMRKL